MRRRIIEQQRELEKNILNLRIENSARSAVYNKDLYNGVVNVVEDTRTRYEREMDNTEQEKTAMSNLKRLFGNENTEIGSSMKLLKSSTNYIKVFNKYFGTIYKDLNGIYNLLAQDFQDYFDRFYDKIRTTYGVELPAQESTLAGVQENLDKLKQETINANDNIKDMVLDSLDVNSLNIAKRLKDYINMIIALNGVFLTTNDPDLRNDMDSLGLTDSFINTELPLLGDTSITIQQKEDILNVVKNCKMPVMRALFDKYGAPPPTKTKTTSGTKSQYNDGQEITHDGKECVIFGKYVYEKDATGFYQNIPSYEIDKNDDINPVRATKSYKPSIKVDDFNADILKRKSMIPAPTPPPMTMTPTFFYAEGTIITYRKKQYIVYDNYGYSIDASNGQAPQSPHLTFDAAGKVVKIDKKSTEYKNAINNQKVIDYNTSLTAPLTGVGLKKSVNTDKIMKILKKLQMKKITGGMNPQKFVSKAAADKFKSKGGMIQSDMGSKVKFIKQTIQARKK